MYNHNKAQQSKNRVHISWDILYSLKERAHGPRFVVLCFFLKAIEISERPNFTVTL